VSAVPYIDPSLGRGLARQSTRKIDRRVERLAERADRRAFNASIARRPAQRLRENVRTVEREFRGVLVADLDAYLVVDAETSERCRVFLFWASFLTLDGHLRAGLTHLDFSYATGNECTRTDLNPVIISEHALQRVHQRLRTIDERRALAELGDAAATLWAARTRSPGMFHQGVSCYVATPHGLAYAEIDPGPGQITITTWIDAQKLRPEQQALRIPGPDAKSLHIRLYSGQKHMCQFGPDRDRDEVPVLMSPRGRG
jgi:hypothetical protein